jgi:hypothetical protein
MRHHHRLFGIALSMLVSATVFAQTTTKSKTTTAGKSPTTSKSTTTTNTTQEPPKTKVDQKLEETSRTIDNTSATMDNASATSEKAKNTFDRITKVFKPKTANEALIIIPDIEFEDENLAKLLEAIKDHKSVKKASLDYTDGVATINATLKNKASTDFWTDLPADIKAYFKMKSKKETSILVAYQKTKESAAP